MIKVFVTMKVYEGFDFPVGHFYKTFVKVNKQY